MIKKIIENYNNKINEIGYYYNTKKDKFLIGLLSFTMSVLIVIGPATLFINMYMYYDLNKLLSLGLLICAFSLFYLSRVFYLQGLTKNRTKLGIVYLVEACSISIFVIFSYIYIIIFL